MHGIKCNNCFLASYIVLSGIIHFIWCLISLPPLAIQGRAPALQNKTHTYTHTFPCVPRFWSATWLYMTDISSMWAMHTTVHIRAVSLVLLCRLRGLSARVGVEWTRWSHYSHNNSTTFCPERTPWHLDHGSNFHQTGFLCSLLSFGPILCSLVAVMRHTMLLVIRHEYTNEFYKSLAWQI